MYPVKALPFSFRHFSKTNAKAIDELWYKRAVDYHFKSPDSFVFSVPHDLENQPTPKIMTASIAIIKEEGNKKAPAGVVGVQIDHEKFTSAFMDVTTEYKVKINYYSEIFI